MTTKTIKFLARVPYYKQAENGDLIDIEYPVRRVLFASGPGPCGKTVVSLTENIENGLLIITQVTECKETKAFVYNLGDIVGRIEVATQR